MMDQYLFDQLAAVRAAYATASWDEISGLQAEQEALLDEIARRSLDRQRSQLRAAGLPLEWARA